MGGGVSNDTGVGAAFLQLEREGNIGTDEGGGGEVPESIENNKERWILTNCIKPEGLKPGGTLGPENNAASHQNRVGWLRT